MFGLSRPLSEHQCAVVIKRARPPRLVRGPGSVRTFGRWKQVVVVDLQPLSLDLPAKTMLTEDHAPVVVSGSIRARVVDPVAAALNVVDYKNATKLIAETALRSLLKERHADELGPASERLEAVLVETIDPAAKSWGVAVSSASLVVCPDEKR